MQLFSIVFAEGYCTTTFRRKSKHILYLHSKIQVEYKYFTAAETSWVASGSTVPITGVKRFMKDLVHYNKTQWLQRSCQNNSLRLKINIYLSKSNKWSQITSFPILRNWVCLTVENKHKPHTDKAKDKGKAQIIVMLPGIWERDHVFSAWPWSLITGKLLEPLCSSPTLPCWNKSCTAVVIFPCMSSMKLNMKSML